MVRVSAHAAALRAIVTVTALAMAFPAFSQAPTDAQRSAVRSACRSDYVAHCSSVPPGGMASLQCLQKNMSSLSSGCQSAVRAVEATAEPKAEAKPEEKSEAKPAEKPQGKSEAKPEEKPEAKPEPAPAAAAATPAEKPAAVPESKAATAAPAKKPSSAQVAAIRSACRSDYMAHCASVPTGGAPALNCLQQNKSKLSGSCQLRSRRKPMSLSGWRGR